MAKLSISSPASYVFERFCLLSFAVPVMWTALKKPLYFGHLTYWTLGLHTVYFTVDKASPYAKVAIYLLHGASFCGAMAVFMGYSFISVGGMYRFGTWIAWENAVGAAAGTVTHDRPFSECAPMKLYEHLWPLIALILDARLSRASLEAVYQNAWPKLTMAVGLGLYLGYATCWESYSKATKGADKGSSLIVYQQPAEFGSSYILGRLGMSAEGVAEDFIFVNAQKALLIGFAAIMYAIVVSPLQAQAKSLAGAPRTTKKPNKKD